MNMDGSEQCDSEACMEKLDMTEFVFLVIAERAREIHCRIITDQWVERNLQTEP